MTNEDRPRQATPFELASEWIRKLPFSSGNVRAAFACWVTRSPENLRSYLRVRLAETELEGLDPQRRIDAQELIRRAREHLATQGNLVRLPDIDSQAADRSLRISVGRRRPGILAAAACLAGLAITGSVVIALHASLAQRFSTAVGEQKQLELPDGSRIVMNTASQLQLSYSSRAREIRLQSGEAFFQVRHDPSRPFRVRLGKTLIEDIGTEFDVRIRSNQASIAVLRGSIRLVAAPGTAHAIDVDGGYKAFLSTGATPATRVTRLSRTDLERTADWTRGVLQLNGEALAEAAEELNRYNPVQIVLTSSSLAALQVGGRFEVRDPLAFALALRQMGCAVTITHDRIYIAPSAAGNCPHRENAGNFPRVIQ